MPKPDLTFAIGLPPEDAIRYFEGKGLKLTDDWRELWQEQHAKAFTVARLAKLDVLKDIHDALNDALKNGTTERQFIKDLTPLLQKKGWWGQAIDKDTGEILETYDPATGRPVEWGSPRRLKLIYRQNMQTAYMAGRYKQQQELALADGPGARPWWQYVAVRDSRTRPTHGALHGRVWRADDPIWNHLYPPNGWNCRCRVRALSEFRMKKEGLEAESSDGQLVTRQVQAGKLPDGSPDMREVTGIRILDRDGRESVMLPDAGWSYNPGKAWLDGLLDTLGAKAMTMPERMAQSALSRTNRELAAEGVFGAWRSKPSGDWPLALLPLIEAESIGARDNLVRISPESMAKQERAHPEITDQEYARAQEVIQNATGKARDGANSMIYVLEEETNGGLVVVVKTTLSGKAIFLTSMRRLSRDQALRDREVQRLLKKGKN